ncbi:dihydrolipoamide dehydrogenase [Anaerospora hongkongensis]|uniref:Dihydrolipoyl dehydrogenase n=1 Tax=Anaerospora hongkongensis TaxID=244830 RepID=A0A4R1PVG7_9FIRM|nr:dihydrolipoyl dehydrogenase [Anaerospora hongkongensis]TCL35361.1 dihydrolipoamide dehydrogenase [Anaerospora hongkongensis]
MQKQVVVIGGGPGGYVAAIRAAQLGARVTVIEQERLGGTCLNIGCIPTKALLHTAELYRTMQKSKALGLQMDNLRIDWPALQNRKNNLVNRLVKGVDSLLKANGIVVMTAKAALSPERTLVADGQAVPADIIILATGSEPVKLAFPGADLPGVIDSTEALNLPAVPKSLIIIGGGVIGVEFAALFSSLGAQVTVVEAQSQILPGTDSELAGRLRQELTRQGVKFYTETRLEAAEAGEQGYRAKVVTGDKVETIDGEYLLVAVGRKPRTEGIGLKEAGINLECGRIMVDRHFATNLPAVYAVGDCNGQLMLAHAASAQGIAAVEHALGEQAEYCGASIPSCIYTTPEAASVGYTEEALQKQGVAYIAGRFALIANGKALIEDGQSGFVKILAQESSGKVVGVHMLGPGATEMIAEGALAIRMGAAINDLITTIHAHPTISEAVGEAALAAKHLAIHLPPQQKASD